MVDNHRAASDDLADRIEACFAANGIGLWALEVVATRPCIGFTGALSPSSGTSLSSAARHSRCIRSSLTSKRENR